MRKSIIQAALFTPFSRGRWGLPIALVGSVGIAKSAMTEEICDELGMPCEVLEPGTRGEAAFGVVPVPSGGKLTYPRPDWTDKFVGELGDKQIPGVIFIDELTTAPPMIQAALLGLALQRRIGNLTLPGCVRVIAAYNPPEQAAGGYDLAQPLANRMGHLTWDAPTVDEHGAYMLRADTGNGGHIAKVGKVEEIETRVTKLWPEAFAMARGLEVSYLRTRTDCKNQVPGVDTKSKSASIAFATDRTWEMATRALAGANVHKLSAEETEIFVASYIGEGAASEFFAYIAQQDLPNPADVLDGKVQWKHDPRRVDRTVAVLSSCSALVTPDKADKRAKRASVFWQILDATVAADETIIDCVIPAITVLVKANLFDKVASKLLKDIQPILRIAKVQASMFGGEQ